MSIKYLILLLVLSVSALAQTTGVQDLYLTPLSDHISGGASCAIGYTPESTIADCGGGTCSGNQRLCVKYADLTIADFSVQDAYLTPQNAHVIGGPVCPIGYISEGDITDCGGGSCSGIQKLCVKKGTGLEIVTNIGFTPEGAQVTDPSCSIGTSNSTIAELLATWV